MTVGAFLKWAGGKPWLDVRYARLLPKPRPGGIYREPFLGGGSLYFNHYASAPAVLSDINGRLIDTYRVVRDHVDELIVELGRHPYDKEHYYSIRTRLNTEPDAPIVERAAWFFVINKYGYNGLYRVSKKGNCNVPFGRHKNPKLCNVPVLQDASAALQPAILQKGGFLACLLAANPEDVIYLDPPFLPKSKTESFTAYTAGGFGPVDQERLARELVRLDALGTKWLLSNSDTPASRELYAGWDMLSVEVPRSISCKGGKRKPVKELLIANYTLPRGEPA